jgi:hypothetical protein
MIALVPVLDRKKICIKCGEEKDINQFDFRNDTGKYRNVCIICNINRAKIRRRELHPRTRRVGPSKSKVDYNKEYYSTNAKIIKEQQKEYRTENKASIRSYNNKLEKEKRKSNPAFRLRKDLSRVILVALKENDGSKHGYSVMDYLPYSIEELRIHLESQFEPWMTWENHGTYLSNKYDANDVFTWTWHIDHIIPQSLLPYSSMGDENFAKCWALNNLRPLKSIDNIRKGNRITKSS